MGELVLLVVAAAWAAVLIPPLIRSRIENRPNSSVTDFRRQLNRLQSTVPSRASGPMRGMARPLTSSPLQRPAAAGEDPEPPLAGDQVAREAPRPLRGELQPLGAPEYQPPLHPELAVLDLHRLYRTGRVMATVATRADMSG